MATQQINLSQEALVQWSLDRQEGELASNQALVVKTGKRTGRSPKDRFIVKDALTETTVAWNAINQALSPSVFQNLWKKAEDHLNTKDCQFISDLRVGAHPEHGLSVRVTTELAWHQLFAQVLFIHPDKTETFSEKDAWQVLSVPSLSLNGEADGVNSDAAVILNFSEKKVLICGTYYAGEMKKAMFSVLNFICPEKNILPMHCAANSDASGKTALFFGLSGTGKTTLSADTERFLIGDDEHGWGEDGIFNFEGGCYAKCIDLSQEREPLIWNAIRAGSVIENVVIDPVTKVPNYADQSLTENTRAAYPREFIPNRVQNNRGQHPSAVLFLTCDLYGVLPPVARLSEAQAAYYFLSGYTALVGSTEVGQGSGIKPTFSTCFGAPFFPRAPHVYAELLIQKVKAQGVPVYLVNTGWSAGAYGEGGSRLSIPVTRQIVSHIVNGDIEKSNFTILPGFNFEIPVSLTGVDSKLLDPRLNCKDQARYLELTNLLIQQFNDNFTKFKVSDAIREAGPVSLSMAVS